MTEDLTALIGKHVFTTEYRQKKGVFRHHALMPPLQRIRLRCLVEKAESNILHVQAAGNDNVEFDGQRNSLSVSNLAVVYENDRAKTRTDEEHGAPWPLGQWEDFT